MRIALQVAGESRCAVHFLQVCFRMPMISLAGSTHRGVRSVRGPQTSASLELKEILLVETVPLLEAGRGLLSV